MEKVHMGQTQEQLFEYFHVETRKDGITIVTFNHVVLREETDGGAMIEELYQIMEQFDHKKVLLVSNRLKFVGTMIIGKVMTLWKKVKALGGKFAFCIEDDNIMEMFTRTKLHTVMTITNTQDAAFAFLST